MPISSQKFEQVLSAAVRLFEEYQDERQLTPHSQHPCYETALRLLGNFKDEKSIELLIQAFEMPDRNIREKATGNLIRIGTLAVLPLIDSLGHNNRNVRLHAAKALGHIKDIRATDALILMLECDIDENCRSFAAWSLGNIGDKKALQPIIKALKDQNGRVRGMAAQALGYIGEEYALASLTELLTDNNEHVVFDASVAIDKLKQKNSFK